MRTCLMLGLLAAAAQQAASPAPLELYNPSWSPDGAQLIYEVNGPGRYALFTVRADGSANRRLSDATSDDTNASWSPDGTRLAFVSNRVAGQLEVFVAGSDWTNPVNLSNDPGQQYQPAWSADSRFIAYVTKPKPADRLHDIVIAELATGARKVIALPDTNELSPSFSPDGARLAFSSDRSGTNEIYSMNLDGSDVRPLTADSRSGSPRWSRQGRIVFGSSRAGNPEIYVMNADGTGVARLTNSPATEGMPTWSPDGTKVAYISRDDSGSKLMVMPAGGGPAVCVQGACGPRRSADSVAATRAFATNLVTRLDLPGLAVVIGTGGSVSASEFVGWADLEGKTPVTTASLFRVGSLSKLLTATAALRMHQAGRFDLDAPLSRHLTALPADKAEVTGRQILGHLSGFRHYGRDDYVNTTKFSNVGESLPRLLAMPLQSPPGAKYAYSSYGYNVLGAALQAAAKKDFRAIIADEVTRPLGMSRTVAESLPAPSGRTELYGRGPQNEITPAQPSDVSDRWPSGGFLSTAEDLARFGMGFLRPDFLRNDLREMAFMSQKGEDAMDTNVGLAWRIARDDQGRRYVHHGGDSIGGRAFLLVYPDLGVVVALTTNVSSAGFNDKDALAVARPFLK